MATLQELQDTLDAELQKTLKGVHYNLKDQEYVKAILWDEIKLTITQITDFNVNGIYPEDLRRHIYQWVNHMGLHATPPTPLILRSLKGKPGPDPAQVYQTYQWLAY